MNSFKPFSKKQMLALCWWVQGSRYRAFDSIICDGAVRSGKTFCMSISFVMWAMTEFSSSSFAICGKTILSVRRNIIDPVLPVLRQLGFKCENKISRNFVEIEFNGSKNRFYLFGGRDESSASLIQGMTLSGILLDEVVLMPRSFVDQAVARCSVTGSRLWFNCNPSYPSHWFRQEWILKASEKNCLYVHFEMRDNPSLSAEMLRRYERLYTGVFRERYVMGRWVAAQGTVYPMFSEEKHIVKMPRSFEDYFISCDYGTVNPSSFGLWGRSGNIWYRIKEYYYNSTIYRERRTDSEHYAELEKLAGSLPVNAVIADPAAASFIELIRRRERFRVIPAKNEVIDGIRKVQDCLKNGQILFSEECRDSIREFGLYRWNENAVGDTVIKADDHAMDDIRYFVSTVVMPEQNDCFGCVSVSRNAR